MEYGDFIKLPDINHEFEEMFSRQRKYFKQKCSDLGILKENLEAVSIKMAFISTDLYFTEVHRNQFGK
jgi:hypothetical protein